MEYIYAALLLHSLKKEITEENLLSVVKSTGVEPDAAKAKMVVSALQGVNIDEVLKSATTIQAAPVVQAGVTEAKKEEKKEEKKSEEEAAAGLAGLFG